MEAQKLPDSHPVMRAFSLFDSQVDFARACEVSQPAVFKWLTGGNITSENAIRIERATRNKNPDNTVWRWELHHIFDKPAAKDVA